MYAIGGPLTGRAEVTWGGHHLEPEAWLLLVRITVSRNRGEGRGRRVAPSARRVGGRWQLRPRLGKVLQVEAKSEAGH